MKLHYSITAAVVVASLTGTAQAARTDVTLGMQLEPPNLDPTAGAAAAIDEVVYANIFEGLTRFAPDGSVLPALASSWEIENEGMRYVFALQQGVTFHDGAEFTADWGEPVQLDKAVFKFISEPTAAFAAIMAGDVDVFPNYPAPENLPQLESDPRFSACH